MKKAIVFSFILFLLLQIEAQAQSYSIMTGIVTEVSSKWLAIKSDEGGTILFRVGIRTVYPSRTPTVGEKVKVEYLIDRGVYKGFSVTILETAKKEIEPQKRDLEARPKLPSDILSKLTSLIGKWEGFWEARKDMHFYLTIQNITLEGAEVKYESRDLKFIEMARVMLGEKTRIEWMTEMVDDRDRFASSGMSTAISRRYPVWYTFELQGDGTLIGTFYHRYSSPGKNTGKALMRRLD